MNRVISIHEYSLKPDVSEIQFEGAILNARQQGLLNLPGLIDCFLVKGIRGSRKGCYAAIWVYESQTAWEKLWGTIQAPLIKEDYPETWQAWEVRILRPFLAQDPDKIQFTAYVEI